MKDAKTMNKYICQLLLTFLVLLLPCALSAQEPNEFIFSHIGLSDGMHSQRIYSVLQTSDGALWWSGKNDIERYNGVNIKHYAVGNEPDKYSDAAGKSIRLYHHFGPKVNTPEADKLLAFDNKGRIFRYDVVHDTFIVLADVGSLMKEQIDVNDILQTNKGFWLATNKGVFFLFEQTLIPVARKFHANYIIPMGKSLLFCTRQGVLEYQQTNDLPQADSPLRTIDTSDAESGFFDPIYNKVWLGGYSSGIRVLSGDLKVETDMVFTHNPVRVIYPYDIHTMLVGIDGKGIYKVSRHPRPSVGYQNELLFNANEGPHGVLHGNGIYALTRDIWGNIIVGSYSGGIDMARPVGTTVAVYQHIPHHEQSILNDHVNSICQSSSGKLLMGTDNGVSIYAPQTKSWTHACQGMVVLHLCRSPRGTILAATYGHGVLELTEDGQSHVLYSKANGTLQDDHVFRMFYDRDGSLWIGGLDGDLMQLKDGAPRHYPIHYVKDMLQLSDGRIVIGTTFGIHLVTPSNGRMEQLNYFPDQEKDANRFVHTLYLNNRSELWIGTDGGGIYIYDFATKACRHLTTENGLPSNFVNTIHKDSKGRLIIATERGLSFADPKNPDRVIGVNYCYGVDREYTSRAAVNLDNGHIMFGSTTGALVVDPNHLQAINYSARLNLLGVNCAVDADDAFKEKIYDCLTRRELCLPYSQRTFELIFEAINLRNQSDIVYRYKVDQDDWSTPTDLQYIRFSSMEAGKHQLMLQAVSRTCGAVLDEVRLTIHIGQPWWNSWWMWIIYICLLALLFDGALRIYQLHTRYMRLVVSTPELSANLQETAEEQAPAEEQKSSEEESNRFISQATKLVIEHISDSEFNIDRLCREMAMSRTLFYVKLKSYTGKSPQDFIRILRLERAAALLRSGHQVTDAAALTGFDNPKYFSTVFKKYFGVSPSKYQ